MNEEEKVIDIKDMLYRVCRQWRSIFMTGFILLICSLLMKLPLLIQFINTSENNALIETIIAYGGLEFIIGTISSIFFYMLSYAFSNKIYLAEDLCQRYEINLIGEIPQIENKRKSLLDNLIKKVFGIKRTEEMQEILSERAAEEITVLAAVRGIEWPNIPVVALVSSCSAEVTAIFEMQISKRIKKDVRLINAGNILQDARSIRMVERADLVVLVEMQGDSIFKEYQETCRKLFLWKKDILGVVLLNTD